MKTIIKYLLTKNKLYWDHKRSVNANKNQITNPPNCKVIKTVTSRTNIKTVSISNHNKQTRRGRVKATKRGRLNIFYCLKGHSTQQKGLMSSPDKLLMPLCGKSGGRSHKSPKGGLGDIVLLLLILKGWWYKDTMCFFKGRLNFKSVILFGLFYLPFNFKIISCVRKINVS